MKGRLIEAEIYFKKAVSIYEKLFGPSDQRIGTVAGTLLLTYASVGASQSDIDQMLVRLMSPEALAEYVKQLKELASSDIGEGSDPIS